MTYEELFGGVLKNKLKITFYKNQKEKKIISNQIHLVKDYLNSPISYKYNLNVMSQKKNKEGINNIANYNIDNSIIQNNLFDYSNSYFNIKNNNLSEKEKINNKFNDKKDKYLNHYKNNGKPIINSIFNKENINLKTEQNLKNLKLGKIVNNNLFKNSKKMLLNNMTYNHFKKKNSPTLKIKEISFDQNISSKSNSKKLDKNKIEDNKCKNTIYLNTYSNKKLNNNINIKKNILNNININCMKVNRGKQAPNIFINHFNKALKIPKPNNNYKNLIYKNYLTNKNESKTNDNLVQTLNSKRPHSNDKNKINNSKKLNVNKLFNKTKQFFYKNKNINIINEDNIIQFQDINSKKLGSNYSLPKMKIYNKLKIRINLDKLSFKNSINFNESETNNDESRNINVKIDELDEIKNKRKILKINNINNINMRNNINDLLFHKTNSFSSYNENINKKPLSSVKRLINEKNHMTSFNKERNNKKKCKIEKIFIQKFASKRLKNNNDDIIDLINQYSTSKEIQ